MSKHPERPRTVDQAWSNYRQNRGWFVLRGKPVPEVLRLNEQQFKQKYGDRFKDSRQKGQR